MTQNTSSARYSRHVRLDGFGEEGQSRLQKTRALVIGLGGVGSPCALYLASAGLGHLTLVDGDTVDLSNLQRQILHTEGRIGQMKAFSAQTALSAINSEVEILPIPQRLDEASLAPLIKTVDIVFDCVDNFEARYAINRVCLHYQKHLISIAAARYNGAVASLPLSREDAACYHCAFPTNLRVEELCRTPAPVFAPLTGIVGALGAAEALKMISQNKPPHKTDLILYDALNTNMQRISIKKRAHCPSCSAPV